MWDISGEDLLLLAVLQDVPDLEDWPGLEDRGTWLSFSGKKDGKCTLL